jgi:hypothetical protein
VWKDLLPHALSIIEDIKHHGTPDPFWTFGGGTVLIFRYQHRLSKDIDIFVPDPQYLGAQVIENIEQFAGKISDLNSFIDQSEAYLNYMGAEDVQIFSSFVAARSLFDPRILEVRKSFLSKKFQARQRIVTQLIISGLIAPTRNISEITKLLGSLIALDPLFCATCCEADGLPGDDYRIFAEERCKIFIKISNEFYAPQTSG